MNEPTIKPPKITAERLYVLSVLHEGTVLGQATRDAAEEIDRLNAVISDVTNERDLLVRSINTPIADVRTENYRLKLERDQLVTMDNAAMDKMQAMIREQSERIAAVASYAELATYTLACVRMAIAKHGLAANENTVRWLTEIDAALAKNPNPAGRKTEDSSFVDVEGAFGAGGAGTVHETGKETGLQKYERTLIERLRPQSCTQSPESIRPHFGWWDHFNEEFVRTPDDVVRRRAAGNKVTPLYIDCECVHQVNRDPLAVLDEWSKKNKAPGDHPEFWRGYHYAREVLYGDSQSVAGKKS